MLIPALLAALLLGGHTAQAQGKNEFNVYLGGYNGEYTKADVTRDYSMDLYAIYKEQYSVSSGPVITFEYNYAILDWLRVGLQVNGSRLKGTAYTRIDNRASDFTRDFLYFLPEVKLRIPSPRHFRLYGKVAAGIRLENSGPAVFAYDLVPIGCEWGGQKVYGTAELAWGNVVRGGRIGIGFRF